MPKIENVQIYGLEESIFRSAYPMLKTAPTAEEFQENVSEIQSAILHEDLKHPHIKRAIQLANAKGGGHDQYLAGITVMFDMTLSNKAWVEAERYRFLTFVSSMSTMHRVAFFQIADSCNPYTDPEAIKAAQRLQDEYHTIDASVEPALKKEAYLKLLYNLPAGFELMAGMVTNYRCLRNIYEQRRNHKLPDWHVVCDWIETLPLAEELIIPSLKKGG